MRQCDWAVDTVRYHFTQEAPSRRTFKQVSRRSAFWGGEESGKPSVRTRVRHSGRHVAPARRWTYKMTTYASLLVNLPSGKQMARRL